MAFDTRVYTLVTPTSKIHDLVNTSNPCLGQRGPFGCLRSNVDLEPPVVASVDTFLVLVWEYRF